MFATETYGLVTDAMVGEYLNAVRLHGESYHSSHEGMAVLWEEVDEAMAEINSLQKHLDALWDMVKAEDTKGVEIEANYITLYSLNAMRELAQVGAVARKMNKGVAKCE